MGDARFRTLDGSLVSVDISGFTALSERLQARGKLGAEELIAQISRCYEGLIGAAQARDGDVLKFRGDALLILFDGPDHALHASVAAVEMQDFIEEAGQATSSVGPVNLTMAAAVATGLCHFAIVGAHHRELLVVGPSASLALTLEDAAEAREVLVSAETAAVLDPDWLGEEREGAFLLRRELVEAPLPDVSEPQPDDSLDDLIPSPLRPILARGAAEPEHRQVTAAFVKYSGTDALVADEAAALAGLEELGDVVGRAVEEFGITWLESDIDKNGGKLYLLAGAPTSQGGDEERMLRALRAIVDAKTQVPVCAGVNRGPAFTGVVGSRDRCTYAVTGDTTNLAARLTGRAKPGQILASAEVLKRSRTRFEAEPQPFLVKGKEKPISAFWVGAIVEREALHEQRLDLVGRKAEVAELQEAVDAARMRGQRVVELVGAPGIGKSRLVEELKTLAVGFQQLVARGEEYESSTPYFAPRSVLRPLVGITPEMSEEEAGQFLLSWIPGVMPDLAPWLPLLAIPFGATVPPTPEAEEIDPAFRQAKLHEVIGHFLMRMLLMPTLFVFEDEHWMDDASRFLLRDVLSMPGPRPWLVVVTRRPHGASFAGLPGGVTLELQPLPREAATELALSALEEEALAADEFASLVERSGGNPVFVRELVAARVDSAGPLPETIESVITARIDTLDAVDRTLLRCAAVIGASFDVDLLQDVLADEVADLDDVARWDELDEFVGWDADGELRFRHDLFRQVAYEGLSYTRRRDLHRRVGEALEDRAGEAGEVTAGLLSRHFLEAAEYDKAWGYAVVAGDRARERFANVDAAEFYERAVAAAGHLTPDPEEVSRIAEALGDVSDLAGRYEAATAAYAHAAVLVEDDEIARARLMRKRGVICEKAGDYAGALAQYGHAIRTVLYRRHEPAAAQTFVDLELEAAGIRHRQGRFHDAMRWSSRAAAHAESTSYRGGLAHAYYLLQIAQTRIGRIADTGTGRPARFGETALAIYEEIGDLVGQSKALNNLGVEAYYAARWREATDFYERAAQLSRRAGDVVSEGIARTNEGEILGDQGHLDAADAQFRDALRILRAAGSRFSAAVVVANLGRTAARTGRFAEAHELLTEAKREFDAIGSAKYSTETSARQSECFVLAGRYADALPLLDAVIAEVVDEEPTALAAMVQRLSGYALYQARRKDEARPRFDESLRIATDAEAEYELALTMRALAETGAPEYGPLADVILERLGVVSTPYVPLP
jgi:predicted ATPase/class 3 adenylate cyclase